MDFHRLPFVEPRQNLSSLRTLTAWFAAPQAHLPLFVSPRILCVRISSWCDCRFEHNAPFGLQTPSIEQQTYQARLGHSRRLREFLTTNDVRNSWALDKNDKLRNRCSSVTFGLVEDSGGSRLGEKNIALRLLIGIRNGSENSHCACLLHLFTALWERIGNPQDGGKLYDLRDANLCAETRHDR